MRAFVHDKNRLGFCELCGAKSRRQTLRRHLDKFCSQKQEYLRRGGKKVPIDELVSH